MEPERASIFAEDNELDVSGFAPKPKSDAPRMDTESLRAIAESRGFTSREAAPAPASGPVSRPAPSPRAPAPARALNFDTRLTIRVSDEAKRRFDDLTYRLRVPNGETFNRLLDLFEATEKKS